MYEHILVPLDGSSRSEHALRMASRIALAAGSTVILFHVASLKSEYGPYLAQAHSFAESVLEAELVSSEIYLKRLADSPVLQGVKTEVVALPGVVVPTLLTYARLRRVDLIIMCSHGYTGFKRWALGSVAQKIAYNSSVPVLLLRENDTETMNGDLEKQDAFRAVVALDGSAIAEAALAPAVLFVAAMNVPGQGALLLKQVVTLPPNIEKFEKNAGNHSMIVQARRDAIDYLSSVSDKLLKGLAGEFEVKINYSVTEDTDVANAIIDSAEFGTIAEPFGRYDMIIMATHGRGGIQHWVLGSMTERVLKKTILPMLIVRPQKQASPILIKI